MLERVEFQASAYSAVIARILAFDGDGLRPIPLAPPAPLSGAACEALDKHTAAELFPRAFSPTGALSGLYLYFGCLDKAHSIAQDLNTKEGSFWHGIMHRQEPDAANAAYWFRQVGKHPIFPDLRAEAHRQRFITGTEWNPFEFIEFCESARLRPGSGEEMLAMRIQLAEWQLLFDYCAREKSL